MIINFGSINIDLVYQVPHMPRPGETLMAHDFARHLGGKGVNQSVAILRSGGNLRHVGCVGDGDTWIADQLQAAGLAMTDIEKVAAPTGHAIIYVDAEAENMIVISGAANLAFTQDQIDDAMQKQDGSGAWVLFQNETNLTEAIARAGKASGSRVCYSAAPFDADVTTPILPLVDLLVVNEQEAEELAAALGCAVAEIPVPMLLVTRGKQGAEFYGGGEVVHQPAFVVDPVDTTGAGDTFLGAFLARFDAGASPAEAMRFAAAASALQVTKPGAAGAIPTSAEVEAFLEGIDA